MAEAYFMGNDTQNNEEQLEMLLMTLEEVRHGICLFQSENQAKRVALIRKRFGEKKVITHNIADDGEETGMVSAQDFRRWASQSNANVVIVYNIQLLGIRFGDDAVVEKLNFMRDQILAAGKLFVLGVSHYFHLLLSRNARDLYSCILYQFTFQDTDGINIGMRSFHMDMLSGDDALAIERYRDMKERIQKHHGKQDISMCLLCMESWNRVCDVLSYKERDFIRSLAEALEQQYAAKEIEIEDVETIWTLADTWIELEAVEKGASWHKKVFCFVSKRLGKEHLLYPDALIEYANYYEAVQDYVTVEKLYDQAIKIYRDKNVKYSPKGRSALQRRAVLYRMRSKFAEALEIYEDLLIYQIDKYGEKYYNNAFLYSNIGRVYEEQGDLSGALLQYKKALQLLEITGKQGCWLALIYQNICVTYLKSGSEKEAWKYIKKAKRIMEDVYGSNSVRLIDIYNCMSGVWEERNRFEKALEYLEKALYLIKKNDMEESEAASYVYHNMANILTAGWLMDEANVYYKYAIKIRERVYGEKNEITASSYEQIAYNLYKTSNHKEVKYYLNKARAVYSSLYGSQNEHIKRIDDYLKSLQSH